MRKSNFEECSEIGIFAGNKLAFSDIVLQQTAVEFSFLNFIRVATINELLDIPREQAKLCYIIIVNEGLADELRQNLPAVFERFKGTRVALAYRQAEIAKRFLRHAAEHPLLAKVGLLPMRLEIDHWMLVLRLLIYGERHIPCELLYDNPPAKPEIEAVTSAKPKHTESSNRLPHLTKREVQILSAVSEGKQNKVIAAELDLSEHTVKLHIHNVITKLGVNNRTEAAIRFLANQPEPSGDSEQ